MTLKNWVRGIFGPKTRTIVTRRPRPLHLTPLEDRLAPDAAPVLSSGQSSQTVLLGSAAVPVDPTVTITDADNTNLQQASVTITNFTAGDVLTATTAGGVTQTYSNGVLTLTGDSTRAVYQSILQSVKYQGTAAGSGPRTFRYSIAPANYYADTTAAYFAGQGHLYAYVDEDNSWAQANSAAPTVSVYSRNGYLAVPTTAGEATFITNLTRVGSTVKAGWLGGSDATNEGIWRWVTGPEGAMNGGTGYQFWDGGPAGSATNPGVATNGLYNNWGGGQPDNFTFNVTVVGIPVGMYDEDFLTITANGTWNDLSFTTSDGLVAQQQPGYYVEYGGQGEANLQLFTTTTINLQTPTPVVTTPSGAVTVGGNTTTIGGTAAANSTVRVYKDNDNNGAINGADSVVATGTATAQGTFSITTVPLTANTANNFLVTAQVTNTVASAAADVPTVTNDATPPALNVVNPPVAFATKNTSVTVAGGTEAGALIEVFRDANGNGQIDSAESVAVASTTATSGTYNLSVPLTLDAVNRFLVTATDGLGNKTNPPVSVPAVTQDSTPPSISVTSPTADTATAATTFDIKGTAEVNATVYVYRDANGNGMLEGGELSPILTQPTAAGSSAFTATVSLNTGANNFFVSATDAVGNASGPVAVKTITQDSTPPTLTITDPTAATTTPLTTYAITGTTEANALVKVYRDLNSNGNLDANETTPEKTYQLTSGSTDFTVTVNLNSNADNYFLVRTNDAAGNLSPLRVVPTISQDADAPVVTVGTPSAATATRNTTFTISGTVDTPYSLIRVYRDVNDNDMIDPGESNPVGQQLRSNTSSYAVSVGLNAGANNFLVTATDVAGNVSNQVNVPTITQDSIDPTLSITAPTTTTYTKLLTIDLTGTTEANALVKVYRDLNDNNLIDSNEATPFATKQLSGGAKDFTIPITLNSGGTYNFLVQANDLAGNVSPVTDVPTITQDAVPPNPVQLTAPTTATTTANTAVTISGTAEAGTLVRVYRGGSVVGQVQLAAGVVTFSLDVGLDLNAANSFTVTATDAAANESAPATVPTVTQDTVAPALPTVTTPASAMITRSASVMIGGTVEAAALVKVYRDLDGNGRIDYGEPVVIQTQLPSGVPGYNLTVGLNANAPNYFLVTATDAAGNQSAPAAVPTITQDSVPPGTVSVTNPTALTYTAATKFSIAGTAEANALVQVYKDNNNNGAIDKGVDLVVASLQLAGGETQYSVLTTLDTGAANNFVVTATDAAGNESSSPADVPTIFQDAVAPPTPAVPTPSAPQTVNAATVTLTISAEGGTLVRVYRDLDGNHKADPGEPVAATAQLSAGVTTVLIPVALTQDAVNNFVVTAIDAAGNESAAAAVPTVTEDSTAPLTPGVTFPAAPTALNADGINVAGAAEPNALVRIYRDLNNNNAVDAGEPVVATLQLAGGATAYSVPAPLNPNAANNFVVTAVDAAGNESAATDVPTVTEDSIPPGTPGVSTPSAPAFTRRATATVAGAAEANALVRLYRDLNNNNLPDPGELLVSQQLANGGTTYTLLASLDANTANNFLVTAADAAGNESFAADVPTLTQDSIPPATPTVVVPGTAAMTVNAASFTITGTAEANALVKVYRDANNNNTYDPDETVVATQQLTGGATAFAVAAPLAQNAANNFLVTAADAAGNESLPADVATINEDATPPAAPAVTTPAGPLTLHATKTTVAGTAEANAVVRVYRDANNNNAVDPGEQPVAQVQLTGGATAFSFDVSLNGDAANNFLVTAADGVGNESAAADVPTVTDDSTAPAGTTVTVPAAAGTINSDTAGVGGTAEPNALVRLYRDRNNNGVIDGGDVVLGQQQLTGGGTAFAIPVDLAQDAANDFLVTAADAVGNESLPVDVPTITEDSTAPPAPTVTAPTASLTVADATYTIRGTADANALVRVYLDANNDGAADGDTPVGMVQLADGATKFAVPTALTPNAANNFVVIATDKVGNLSPAADVPTIYADLTGPTGPTPQAFDLSGSSTGGTIVGTVQATTAAGGPLTYLITDGDDAGVFALDRATGQLTVADANALRRSPRRLTLMVRVSDAADTPLTKTFEVNVSLTDPALPKAYAAGSESGGGVAVLYNVDGTRRLTVEAFPGATGGVRVAAADVNGDGTVDLVAASGPGETATIKVYDGVTKALIYQSSPFETFTGGIFVEAADLTGDGKADVVLSPDVGGGPRVIVIDVAARRQVASFYGIEDPAFRGGCRVSLADHDADGTPDLLVSAGIGGGPRVALFDGAALAAGSITHLIGDFFVFENTLRNGVYVAGGDLNGDGYADIIAGGGPGGAPRVFAVSMKDMLQNGTQVVLANFFAGDPDKRTAVRVAAADLDGDKKADIIAGAGSDNGDRIVVYLGKDITPEGTPPANPAFNKIDSSITFQGGVNVG